MREEKMCSRCKKPAAFSTCADCYERYRNRSLREVFVSHNSSYGFRLIAGFNLMRYAEDEYVE